MSIKGTPHSGGRYGKHWSHETVPINGGLPELLASAHIPLCIKPWQADPEAESCV